MTNVNKRCINLIYLVRRVKNSLHAVICLLESPAYFLENDTLRAIEISQHRIYAIDPLDVRILIPHSMEKNPCC